MKNEKKYQKTTKIVLKNGNCYVIIRLPKFVNNIVNKHTNIQTNAVANEKYKNIKKGFVKIMSVQTVDTAIKNERTKTKVISNYVDFESAARYLATLFFSYTIKETHSAIHCTLPKIEKLLAIAAIVQYRKGVKVFYEDILIKKCGVGFDCLDWPSEIIDMRKDEDYFNTGETNSPINDNIVQNSIVIPKLYYYEESEQLSGDMCNILESVFLRFANYKASSLGAMFDDFKAHICSQQDGVVFVDSNKVIDYFSIVDQVLYEKNQVYNFILNI